MTVYFVQDGGPGGHIKIGYTAGNPHSRIASFRTGNPRPLALLVAIPGGPEDERALHKRFDDLRESGEWFRSDARLLGFIEGMQHAYPEQPKDPGPVPTLFGFDGDQLNAIAGRVRTHELHRQARDVRHGLSDPSNHSDGGASTDLIEYETLCECERLIADIESMLEVPEDAHLSNPYFAGAWSGNGREVLKDHLDWLRTKVDRHYAEEDRDLETLEDRNKDRPIDEVAGMLPTKEARADG